MNLYNIIQNLEQIDPEFQEKLNPRRAALKSLSSFGSKVALSALPLALGSMFKKAEAATTTEAIGVLNFALTLEHLEAKFYTKGIEVGIAPAGTPAAGAIMKIKNDEVAHVNFLTTVITSLGGTPVNKTFNDFKFTDVFPDVFTNYDTFLAVAQAFEDTGVRAYKGQAPALKGEKTFLTAALNIHSVEARHASHIRQMRRARANASGNTTTGAGIMKPWITGGNDSGIGAIVNNIYAGEENKVQATVDITTLNGVGGKISLNAAIEAFDEFLTTDQVLAIVGPFIR